METSHVATHLHTEAAIFFPQGLQIPAIVRGAQVSGKNRQRPAQLICATLFIL